MHPVIKKLGFKGQAKVLVVNAPDSFQSVLAEMSTLTTVSTTPDAAASPNFALAFVTKQQEVDELSAKLAPLLPGDCALWFAYPKGTSKRYKCEFNRDTGWAVLGQAGFEPVSQVAIDEDWSALRFRRVEFIKTMTRRGAISEAGKQRIGEKS